MAHWMKAIRRHTANQRQQRRRRRRRGKTRIKNWKQKYIFFLFTAESYTYVNVTRYRRHRHTTCQTNRHRQRQEVFIKSYSIWFFRTKRARARARPRARPYQNGLYIILLVLVRIISRENNFQIQMFLFISVGIAYGFSSITWMFCCWHLLVLCAVLLRILVIVGCGKGTEKQWSASQCQSGRMRWLLCDMVCCLCLCPIWRGASAAAISQTFPLRSSLRWTHKKVYDALVPIIIIIIISDTVYLLSVWLWNPILVCSR